MCDICKTNTTPVFTSRLHFSEYEPVTLKLCLKHDIELFKRGQVGFLKSHRHELADVLKGTKPVDSNLETFDLNFA